MVVYISEFDIGDRGKNYRRANDGHPYARAFEILHMLKYVNPQEGQTIVEFGTGNGILTMPLAKAVEQKGKVITLDDSVGALEGIRSKAREHGLAIEPVLQDQSYFETGRTSLPDSVADTVTSIATMHHYDENKEMAFREFYRLLKPGGTLVIADVADNTAPQRYFDGFVHYVCSVGHDHRFLDKRQTEDLCKKTNLELCSWHLEFVPWVFDSEEQAMRFLHRLHDATCAPQESLEGAMRYLRTFELEGRFALSWELFYAVVRKEGGAGVF